MKYFKYILFLLILIPFNAYAYVGALDEGAFYINNQTTQPFNLTISGNSNVTASFHLVWDWYHGGDSNLDLPGSYLFFSIVSDKQIDIERSHTFGNFCTQSCFSNDKYLQLVESDGSSYSYVFYFNIVKWARNVGTQVDLFNVDDQFKFINKESGTAHVYIYGAYSNATNQIPELINNANTVQQIIIDGQTNTDYIIDNQNDIKEAILDSSKVCNILDKKYIVLNNYVQFVSGALVSYDGIGVSSYIPISSDSSLKVVKARSGSAALVFFDLNKDVISGITNGDMTTGQTLTIPTNTRYIRYSIRLDVNEPVFELCNYGNQAINDSINGMNDNMTDPSIDNPSGDFEDMESYIASNGIITQLIVLPITLYSAVLNTINGTCSNYSFGELFGTELSFSCISVSNLVGSSLFNTIDILCSGFFVWHIAKKMIKTFNHFTELKEGDVLDD